MTLQVQRPSTRTRSHQLDAGKDAGETVVGKKSHLLSLCQGPRPCVLSTQHQSQACVHLERWSLSFLYAASPGY